MGKMGKLFGCPTFKEKISAKHSAVIVVDIQNIFCSGNQKPLTSQVVLPIERFLSKVRDFKVPLIFIKQDIAAFKNSPTGREILVRNGKASLLKDDSKDKLAGELCIKPQPHDKILTKTTYSAFFKTSLSKNLHKAGIKTIIATGVATNVCVETTVRDAFMHGFYCIVLKDLVASYDERLHESALENINTNFGEVCHSMEILSEWEKEGRHKKVF